MKIKKRNLQNRKFMTDFSLAPAQCSPLRCSRRMAAAAAAINKQGAVGTMEPCARFGRGAHGGTVKVTKVVSEHTQPHYAFNRPVVSVVSSKD